MTLPGVLTGEGMMRLPLTILYRWALTEATACELEAQGWERVAVHPVFEARSVLMRKDEATITTSVLWTK
jgi:hypothetical protein